MKAFLDWLDDRTGYRPFLREALYERVPGGARWRYVWGSTLVFAFFVQLVTGLFLWTAYSPNSQGAWESVYYLQYEMQGGWLLRGVHHFMAQAMVVLLALHLMQVVIDGAYKAPREVNFWLGLLLMLVVLGLSLTGYLLPWDQKGYWATKVATNIAALTPGIGPQLQALIVGGTEYGHHTLTRFFALHAGLLPGLLIGLLLLHISVFRRHGLTAHRPDPRRDTTFWPDQVLRDSVACLAVLAVVLFLVFQPYIFEGRPIGPQQGAHLGPPADPSEQYSAARPEWYFLFLYELLKYFPGEWEIIGSHVIPGLAMLLLALMPFFGRWRLGHRFNVAFLGCVMLGIAALTGTAFYKDRHDENYLAATRKAETAAQRVVQLAETKGIRAGGAVELIRNDPFLQGPEIFARRCASCHRFNGHDGTGKIVTERVDGETVPVEPTAADLGHFGTRGWLRSVLTDYKGHFAPLANMANSETAAAFLENGQMVGWSESNRETLLKPENEASLNALIEFVVSQSRRDDLKPYDAELVRRGRTIFETGEMAAGKIDACVNCHALQPVGEDERLGSKGLAPVLTGYGGRKWLREFIADPGAEKFYGNFMSTNAMPAFGDQLTDRELDLLIRWMTRDFHPPPAGEN